MQPQGHFLHISPNPWRSPGMFVLHFNIIVHFNFFLICSESYSWNNKMQCMYESHQLSYGYYLTQKHFVTWKLSEFYFWPHKVQGRACLRLLVSQKDYISLKDGQNSYKSLHTWIIYNLEIMVLHSYVESQDSSPRDR